MAFNKQQLDQLFKEINPKRVAERKGMSYLETWDVIAHLNRIFGFEGWDKHVLDLTLIYESQREVKDTWDVAYRATVRLVVHDSDGFAGKTSEDAATGQAQNQPSRGDAHDLAVKSAVSDALKRCAKDLGNQFGLSLYDKGSTRSVVGRSLAYEEAEPETTPPEAVPQQTNFLREALTDQA